MGYSKEGAEATNHGGSPSDSEPKTRTGASSLLASKAHPGPHLLLMGSKKASPSSHLLSGATPVSIAQHFFFGVTI